MKSSIYAIVLVSTVLLAGCAGDRGTATTDLGSGPDAVDADADSDVVFVPIDAMDAAATDTTPPDTAPPDVPLSCDDDPGGTLCPCTENADCNAGFCVPHMGDRICTMECVEDCPDGFSCLESEGFGADLVYLCWSDFPGLCLPCSQSADCPDQKHRCVLYPDGIGSFCGGACQLDMPEPDCPPGWECQTMTTMEGDQVPQCVLPDGECPCSDTAIADVLGTHCYAINDHGVCSGWRVCTEDGLSDCDAPEPGPEVCFNDVDEDCDGVKDDPDVCCFPHCEGKVCGNDGCGGSCGECAANEMCTGEGQCACVPDCAGKQCGSDSCDGSCGDCPAQYVCTGEGLCECVPDCQDKDCGDDSCSGSCGDCPLNHVCTDEYICVCVPNCTDKECGDDGCGVSCGECGLGTLCVFGMCQDGCETDDDCALLEKCIEGFCQPPPEVTGVVPDRGTVLGGTTVFIQGENFVEGLTLTFAGAPLAPVSVASDVIQFVTPAHARGPVDIAIENPSGQGLDLSDHFRYVLEMTPTLDGNLGDWDPLFKVADNNLESNWNPANNHLNALSAAFDGVYLYLAVEGSCEDFNYILGYVDQDFGLGTGLSDLLGLSDNDGDGDLDDAISNILHVDVPGFGADHAFGSRGMASFMAGNSIDESLFVGWRSVNDLPYDLPWLQGTVACSSTACEAAFSLSMLYPQGVPPSGADVAAFIKLTDRYGNADGISNQAIPESWDPDDPPKIDAVAQLKVF